MFSVAITGLQAQGLHRVWAMGRMDLVATELVGKTKHLMESRKSSFYDTDWQRIEDALEAERNDIELLVAFAPHKMVFNGAEMESAADGANERTDIYLAARRRNDPKAYMVGYAYHTTNAPKHTFSGNNHIKYPETRILWTSHMKVLQPFRLAAAHLAQAWSSAHNLDMQASA